MKSLQKPFSPRGERLDDHPIEELGMEPGRFRRHKGTRIYNPHQFFYRNRVEGESDSPGMKGKKAPELLPCPLPAKKKTP
jgi:hypothetical protein